MQKVISFDKNLEFKTMVSEITSISLDQHLAFIDESSISGELVISGKYKLTAASRLEEDFIFHLPIEIFLTEKLEEATRKVTIEDFRYDIQEDDTLDCHVELLIEGVEIIDVDEEVDTNDDRESVVEELPMEQSVEDEEQSKNLVVEDTISKRECDNDMVGEIMNNSEHLEGAELKSNSFTVEKESVSEVISATEVSENSVEVGSLFSSFKESDETFATYSVYIFRQNDTIEAVMDKYQVTKEELENYNDLSSLTIGSKLIIPTQSSE